MPTPFRLPDGRWVNLPDDPNERASLEAAIAARFPGAQLPSSSFGRSFMDDISPFSNESAPVPQRAPEPDEGNILGSVWEGIKQIPYGLMDVPISMAESIVGVATPHADLDVEKWLRKMGDHGAQQIDPKYADAFLPKVGMGLGQVAGMVGASLLGGTAGMVGSKLLGGGAMFSLGISEQTRRIAEEEQRTGRPIAAHKQSMAHALGALTALTEKWSLKKIVPGGQVFGKWDDLAKQFMEGTIKTQAAREIVRKGIGAVGAEAMQEAGQQFLQASIARGLYDRNAMDNIIGAMAEDAKVGGVVGGLASVMMDLMVRGITNNRVNGLSGQRKVLEEAIRRGTESAEERAIEESGGIDPFVRRDHTGILQDLVGNEAHLGPILSEFGAISDFDHQSEDSINEAIADQLRRQEIAIRQVDNIEEYVPGDSGMSREELKKNIQEATFRNITSLGNLLRRQRNRRSAHQTFAQTLNLKGEDLAVAVRNNTINELSSEAHRLDTFTQGDAQRFSGFDPIIAGISEDGAIDLTSADRMWGEGGIHSATEFIDVTGANADLGLGNVAMEVGNNSPDVVYTPGATSDNARIAPAEAASIFFENTVQSDQPIKLGELEVVDPLAEGEAQRSAEAEAELQLIGPSVDKHGTTKLEAFEKGLLWNETDGSYMDQAEYSEWEATRTPVEEGQLPHQLAPTTVDEPTKGTVKQFVSELTPPEFTDYVSKPEAEGGMPVTPGLRLLMHGNFNYEPGSEDMQGLRDFIEIYGKPENIILARLGGGRNAGKAMLRALEWAHKLGIDASIGTTDRNAEDVRNSETAFLQTAPYWSVLQEREAAYKDAMDALDEAMGIDVGLTKAGEYKRGTSPTWKLFDKSKDKVRTEATSSPVAGEKGSRIKKVWRHGSIKPLSYEQREELKKENKRRREENKKRKEKGLPEIPLLPINHIQARDNKPETEKDDKLPRIKGNKEVKARLKRAQKLAAEGVTEANPDGKNPEVKEALAEVRRQIEDWEDAHTQIEEAFMDRNAEMVSGLAPTHFLALGQVERDWSAQPGKKDRQTRDFSNRFLFPELMAAWDEARKRHWALRHELRQHQKSGDKVNEYRVQRALIEVQKEVSEIQAQISERRNTVDEEGESVARPESELAQANHLSPRSLRQLKQTAQPLPINYDVPAQLAPLPGRLPEQGQVAQPEVAQPQVAQLERAPDQPVQAEKPRAYINPVDEPTSKIVSKIKRLTARLNNLRSYSTERRKGESEKQYEARLKRDLISTVEMRRRQRIIEFDRNRELVNLFAKQLSDIRNSIARNSAARAATAKRLGFESEAEFAEWVDKATVKVQKAQEVYSQFENEVGREVDRQIAEIVSKQGTEVPAEVVVKVTQSVQEDKKQEALPKAAVFDAMDIIRFSRLLHGSTRNSNAASDAIFNMQAIAGIVNWSNLHRIDDRGGYAEKATADVLSRFEKKFKETGKVEDSDIEQLLNVKNIFLRSRDKLGNLVGDIGYGFESTPFVNMLKDFTGADSWASATTAQRFLMYSKLLSLPSNRGMKSIYLPDLYDGTELMPYKEAIVKNVSLNPGQGSVQEIYDASMETMRDADIPFNNDRFDNALAQLIESGLLEESSQQVYEEVLESDSPVVETYQHERETDEEFELRKKILERRVKTRRKLRLERLEKRLEEVKNREEFGQPDLEPEQEAHLRDHVRFSPRIDGSPEVSAPPSPLFHRKHGRAYSPLEQASRKKGGLKKRILSGSGTEWLSNDSPLGLIEGEPTIYEDPLIGPVEMKSAEHAYQAQKTIDPAQRRAIYAASTPTEARQLASKIAPEQRPDDWNSEKQIELMRDILRTKFREGPYATLLRNEPGSLMLDDAGFWGEELGPLLEEIRSEFNPDLVKSARGMVPPPVMILMGGPLVREVDIKYKRGPKKGQILRTAQQIIMQRGYAPQRKIEEYANLLYRDSPLREADVEQFIGDAIELNGMPRKVRIPSSAAMVVWKKVLAKFGVPDSAIEVVDDIAYVTPDQIRLLRLGGPPIQGTIVLEPDGDAVVETIGEGKSRPETDDEFDQRTKRYESLVARIEKNDDSSDISEIIETIKDRLRFEGDLPVQEEGVETWEERLERLEAGLEEARGREPTEYGPVGLEEAEGGEPTEQITRTTLEPVLDQEGNPTFYTTTRGNERPKLKEVRRTVRRSWRQTADIKRYEKLLAEHMARRRPHDPDTPRLKRPDATFWANVAENEAYRLRDKFLLGIDSSKRHSDKSTNPDRATVILHETKTFDPSELAKFMRLGEFDPAETEQQLKARRRRFIQSFGGPVGDPKQMKSGQALRKTLEEQAEQFDADYVAYVADAYEGLTPDQLDPEQEKLVRAQYEDVRGQVMDESLSPEEDLLVQRDGDYTQVVEFGSEQERQIAEYEAGTSEWRSLHGEEPHFHGTEENVGELDEKFTSLARQVTMGEGKRQVGREGVEWQKKNLERQVDLVELAERFVSDNSGVDPEHSLDRVAPSVQTPESVGEVSARTQMQDEREIRRNLQSARADEDVVGLFTPIEHQVFEEIEVPGMPGGVWGEFTIESDPVAFKRREKKKKSKGPAKSRTVLQLNPEMGPKAVPEIGQWFSTSEGQDLLERLVADPDTKNKFEKLLELYNKNSGVPMDALHFASSFFGRLNNMNWDALSLDNASNVALDMADSKPKSSGSIRHGVYDVSSEGLGREKGVIVQGDPNDTNRSVRNELREINDRFRHAQAVVKRDLAEMGIERDVAVEYVADLHSMWQVSKDVAIKGEAFPDDVQAIYDKIGNRIIINLSRVDPYDHLNVQQILKRGAFHEGIHHLYLTDRLSEREIGILFNYVENNVVDEGVDPEAHRLGLTYYEKAALDPRYDGLHSQDLKMEASIEVLEGLASGTISPSKSAGAVGTIKKDLVSFIKSFVDPAKESAITPVVAVLANIQSGAVGARGSGYRTAPRASEEVRSSLLARYAEPKELDDLSEALTLAERAKTEEDKDLYQRKADDIIRKITETRDAVRESAPPPPDAVRRIQNKMRAEDINTGTHFGGIPLINSVQQLEHLADRFGEEFHEAYDWALDEYMKMRENPSYSGYTSPSRISTMFRRQTNLTDLERAAIEQDVANGVIERGEKSPDHKSIEDSAPIADGQDVEKTISTLLTTTGQYAQNYLDSRQKNAQQQGVINKLDNRVLDNAFTSALVAMRWHDNTLNMYPGMIQYGPISYVGPDALEGEFSNEQLYDDELISDENPDGRIPGLRPIFDKFVPHETDVEAANVYGIAERVKHAMDEMKVAYGAWQSEPEGPRKEYLHDLYKEASRYADDVNPWVSKGKRRFTDEWVAERIALLGKNKNISEFWKYMKAYNRAFLKAALDTELITQEIYDKWSGRPWTPFYSNVVTDVEASPFGMAEGVAYKGANKIERAIDGGVNPIKGDLYTNMEGAYKALIRDMTGNVAVRRIVRDTVRLEEAEEMTAREVKDLSDTANIVRVHEKGVTKFYRFDDVEYAKSIMLGGVNPRAELERMFGGGVIGKVAAKAFMGMAQVLREAVTRMPPYMFRNIVRDSMDADVTLGNGPPLIFEALKNAFDPSSLERAARLHLAIGLDVISTGGGQGGADLWLGRFRTDVKKLNWLNPFSVVSAIWQGLGRMASQSEVAVRLAIYDRVRDGGGNHALAKSMALELLNYGRRGADPLWRTFMATVPFMNGRIQGLHKLWRVGLGRTQDAPDISLVGMSPQEQMAAVEADGGASIFRRRRNRMFSRGLMLSAMSGLYYFFMHDDEEYKLQRPEVKSDNWLIPMSKGTWLKIPIPFEIGVLFKAFPEQMMKVVMEKETDWGDATKQARRHIRNSLAFGPPQLIAPIMDAMQNYDSYRGDYIVDPLTSQTIGPEHQYGRYTSNLARGVAKLTNNIPLVKHADFLTSPMKLEYMMRQYLGTAGAYGVLIADRVARSHHASILPWLEAENVVGTNYDFDWGTLMGKEGWREQIANVPMLGDMLIDPRQGNANVQMLYDIVREVDQFVATKGRIEERDWREGMSYMQQRAQYEAYQKEARQLERAMAQQTEIKEFVMDRLDLSNQEKRNRLQRVTEMTNRILARIADLRIRLRTQPERAKEYTKIG